MSEVENNIIYVIKNQVNNKLYIGRTSREFRFRLKEHFSGATNGKTDTKLSNDIRKYRKYNFSWHILKNCKDKTESIIFENNFIKAFNSIEIGYNTMLNAFNSEDEIVEWKEKAKEINKERLTGVAMTEANKNACSISQNKLFTDEEIKYIQDKNNGSCETVGEKFGISRHRAEYIRSTGTDKLTEARERGNGNKVYNKPTNPEWRYTILSDKEIKEIKESGEIATKLAEVYNISDKRIGFIKRYGFDKNSQMKKWEAVHGSQKNLKEYKAYILATYGVQL